MSEIINHIEIDRPQRITGGILAGGQGSRLGGQDKGWVDWHGLPLIQHVINRLGPQVDGLLINCNRNQARYAELGYPVVMDQLADFQGPLAGIAALLSQIETQWLLIVPCDGPKLPLNLAERLMAAATEHGATIAVAENSEFIQPMHALIHHSLAASLSDFLADGQRKPMQWYRQQSLCKVAFNDKADAFFNINRETELDSD